MKKYWQAIKQIEYLRKKEIYMKRYFPITLLLCCCLIACQENNKTFILNGNISNLENDTLFIFNEYGNNGKMDTIIANNGQFIYTVELDTITPFTLLINGETTYPIYADKSLEVSISGNASEISSLSVEGGIYNEDLNRFKESIKALNSENDRIKQANDFILNNPSSYANVYLLNTYFIQKDSIDFKKVNNLIKSMSGEIQDLLYTKKFNEIAKQHSEANLKYLPSFNIKDKQGKLLSSSNYRDKILVIHFWATWDKASLENNQMFKRIYNKYKKEKEFDILGISFDIDKNIYQNTLEKDTIQWGQALEPDGFDSRIAQQFNIEKLPAYLLINAQREIVAINPDEKELINQIEKALKEEKSRTNKRKR